MSKDDLVKVMQIAISLLDKGDASKANGVLKIGLTGYFNSGRQWFNKIQFVYLGIIKNKNGYDKEEI